MNVERERNKQKTKPTQHGCYINSMWPIKIIFLLGVREILFVLELMFFLSTILAEEVMLT